MKREQIVVTDLRGDDKTTSVDDVPVGAIVAYVTDKGAHRRGVVIERTPKTLTVLDGTIRERLIGKRYTEVQMLAPSAEAFTRRAAEQAQELRSEQGWCGVPNTMIRDLNSTPVIRQPLIVAVTALYSYQLEPTPLTRRRKDLTPVIKEAFSPRYPEFRGRDFSMLETPRMTFNLEVVDALPELR